MVKPQVYRTQWWMAHYGGKTPKRHYGYANSPSIQSLDKGRLVGWKKRDKSLKVETAVQYRDRSGRLRYKGTKHLKKTEPPDFKLVLVVPYYTILIFIFPFSGFNIYTDHIPVDLKIYNLVQGYSFKVEATRYIYTFQGFWGQDNLVGPFDHSQSKW